jgi:hypothetical protein
VCEYASGNLDAIGREKRVRDETAANRINELLGELDRAIAALRAEAHESDQLVTLAGLQARTHGTPASLGVERLREAIRDTEVRLPSAQPWA